MAAAAALRLRTSPPGPRGPGTASCVFVESVGALASSRAVATWRDAFAHCECKSAMFVPVVSMCVDVLYKSEARMLKGMLGALPSVSLRGPCLLDSRGTAGQNPRITWVLGLTL